MRASIGPPGVDVAQPHPGLASTQVSEPLSLSDGLSVEVSGGVPVSTLAAAGRVRELTSGAVARGDAAFLAHPSPWCTTHF